MKRSAGGTSQHVQQRAQPIQTGLGATATWDSSCSLDLLTHAQPSPFLSSSKGSSLLTAQAAFLLLQPLPYATAKQTPHPSPYRRSSSANGYLKVQPRHLGVRAGASEKSEWGSFWTESHMIKERKEKAAQPTQSKVHLHGGAFYSTKK